MNLTHLPMTTRAMRLTAPIVQLNSMATTTTISIVPAAGKIRHILSYLTMQTMNKLPIRQPLDDMTDCPECPKCHEEAHPDEMVDIGKHKFVCIYCFEHQWNEFVCDNVDCPNEDFKWYGVATYCPYCLSQNISHEFVSTTRIIRERQKAI